MSNPHEKITVSCAGCGVVKDEVNHWFLTSSTPTFRCKPYPKDHKLRKGEEPACGQQCAQRLFEKYLTATRLQVTVAEVVKEINAEGVKPDAAG